MNWDNDTIELCIGFIESALNKKDLDLWEFVKNKSEERKGFGFYYKRSNRKNVRTKKYMSMKVRLKHLEELGLVSEDKENGLTVFKVNTDKIFLKEGKFIDNKKRTYLCVRYLHRGDDIEKWDAFEI